MITALIVLWAIWYSFAVGIGIRSGFQEFLFTVIMVLIALWSIYYIDKK